MRDFDRQHAPSLYREAAHALKAWHRAEDVVQDALIKVWQRCATFRGESHPLAWVRQIVRRAVLDELRRRPPEEPLEGEDGEFTAAAAQAVVEQSRETVTQPDDALDERVLQGMYRQAWSQFERVHPEAATVLRWVIEDGMDQAELAALLGRSPGATREYISQCRKKARPFLQAWREALRGRER